MQLPTLFNYIQNYGINAKLFDEDLYAIKYRYRLIQKLISKYVKKFVSITDYNPSLDRKFTNPDQPLSLEDFVLVGLEGRVFKRAR